MVKKRVYFSILLCCFVSVICENADATLMKYVVTDLSSGQFECEYTLINNNSVAIQEFTIWFDVQLYDNLVLTTEEPLASQWDEIILKKTGFGLPIGYDAKSLTGGILHAETLNGFSVKFDWFGTGIPGSQFFEIIDPTTFQTIHSGYTVPEPATIFLLGLGGLALRAKRKP